MKRRLPVFLLQLAFILVIRCGSNTGPTAGGATDSPNALAGAVLASETRTPVAGVTVHLFQDTKGDTSATIAEIPGSIEPADSTVTDSSGRYKFKIYHSGVYAILAQTPDLSKVLHLDGIVVDNKDVHLEPRELRPSATVRGYADLPDGPEYTVLIRGTPVRKMIPSTGDFILEGLYGETAEVWIVLSYPISNVKNIAALDTIALTAGDTALPDTFRIHPVLPVGDRLIIDNGDDHRVSNSLGGVWWNNADSTARLHTLDVRDSTAGFNGTSCVKLEYTLGPDDTDGVMLGVNMGIHPRPPGFPKGIKQARDLSAARALRFRARGTGQALRVWFHSGLVGNWNDLTYTHEHLEEDWQLITIDFAADLHHALPSQGSRGWNDVGRGIDAIIFSGAHDTPGESGAFFLDDVELLF